MKSIATTILLSATLLLSCNKDDTDTKELNFGVFRLTVPANWKKMPDRQGIDSRVGGITDGKDQVEFDYGAFSNDFRAETSATHERTTTTISGRQALIVRPRDRGKGLIGAHIDVDGRTKLSLYGHNVRDEETVLTIFYSVKL